MRKILITGANSYIGTSFEAWVTREELKGQYKVDTLDMISHNMMLCFMSQG